MNREACLPGRRRRSKGRRPHRRRRRSEVRAESRQGEVQRNSYQIKASTSLFLIINAWTVLFLRIKGCFLF